MHPSLPWYHTSPCSSKSNFRIACSAMNWIQWKAWWRSDHWCNTLIPVPPFVGTHGFIGSQTGRGPTCRSAIGTHCQTLVGMPSFTLPATVAGAYSRGRREGARTCLVRKKIGPQTLRRWFDPSAQIGRFSGQQSLSQVADCFDSFNHPNQRSFLDGKHADGAWFRSAVSERPLFTLYV